jgi:hypothetical protein
MTIDAQRRAWLDRVHEHKTLARQLREGRLIGEARVRYDALTRDLLRELTSQRPGVVPASPVPVEEVVRVAPAALGLRPPHEGVEGVDAAGVVAVLGGRAEGA